jgi:hypothetical protein
MKRCQSVLRDILYIHPPYQPHSEHQTEHDTVNIRYRLLKIIGTSSFIDSIFRLNSTTYKAWGENGVLGAET